MREQNEKIHATHVFGLVTIFIQGVVYTNFSSQSKQDDWIVALFSAVVMLPLVAVYLRIFRLNPEMNLFEIFDACLGKLGGKITTCVFIVYTLVICALSIRNFTEFVRVMILPNTPILYVTAFFCFLCLCLARKGMLAIGRYSLYVVPFAVVVGLITLFLSIDVMNAKRLLPVMGQPLSQIAEDASVMSLITFGQVLLPLGLLPMQNRANGQGKGHGKAVWLAYAAAAVYILVTFVRAIAILGGEAYSGFFYPIYASYSVLHIGNSVSHLDPLVTGGIVAMILVRSTLFLRFMSMGTSRLVGSTDDTVFSLPLIAIVGGLSIALYHYSTDKNALDLLVRWFSVFTLILVPLVLWVISEARKSKRRSLR